ncbi:hypothetical protein TWF694_010709 [Orbilia ellipsospora]|uniref:Uncharacterized protein n=1 Tax=Orbilia ellipsospora TaxID=2528407 RepID=A0AAV9X6U3_9PEZI
MKCQVLGFLVASLVAVVSCQSAAPSWGVGAFGGVIGSFDPKVTTAAPIQTDGALVSASATSPVPTSTGGAAAGDFTSTTTRFVTTYTTVTVPVTMQANNRRA